MMEALVRTLHLIGALGTGISVLLVVLASRRLISLDDLAGVRRVYLALLMALALTAVAGLMLWLWVGKPAAFFSNNPVFHAKLGLFALVLLMLAWPGWYFSQASSRRPPADNVTVTKVTVEEAAVEEAAANEVAADVPSVPVSALILRLQKATLPLLVLIPILAYLMARGIGY